MTQSSTTSRWRRSRLRAALVGVGLVAGAVAVSGADPISAQTPTPPDVFVVNAFTTGQIDIYIDGELSRGGVEPLRQSGMLQGTSSTGSPLPEGTYDIDVYPKEAGPAAAPADQQGVLASETITICNERVYSLAYHPDAAGSPTLSFFEDDMTNPGTGNTRITVRHVGEAGTLDIELGSNGENSGPATNSSFSIDNGGTYTIDQAIVNDYEIFARQGGTLVTSNPDAEAEGETHMIAWIMGSPPETDPPGRFMPTYDRVPRPDAPAPAGVGSECGGNDNAGGATSSTTDGTGSGSGSSGGTSGSTTGTGGSNNNGSTGGSEQPPTPSKFNPLDPTRVLDTRGGRGVLADGESVTVDLSTVSEIPDDATAVVATIIAAQTQGTGYLTATAIPPSRPPNTSSVNWVGSGEIAGVTVTVPLSQEGQFNVFVRGGAAVIADISGYYTPAETSTDGRYVPIDPARAFDTRDSETPSGPLTAGSETSFDMDTLADIPAGDVSAVVLNVASILPAERGWVTVRTGDSTATDTSALNFEAGEIVANQVIVPVDSEGMVDFVPSVDTGLIVDVFGYFTSGSAADDDGGLFVNTGMIRALDTRIDTVGPATPIPAMTAVPVPAAVQMGVDPGDMIAVSTTLVSIRPEARTFFSVYAAGAELTDTSVLNAEPGDVVANSVYAPVASGVFQLYSSAESDAVADIAGYFQTSSSTT